MKKYGFTLPLSLSPYVCVYIKVTLTIESTQRPITANICRAAGQLEGKGPSVGRQVGVAGRDVDGIGIRLLTHFHLGREDVRSIVIDVQQVHLEGAGPAGGGDTCTSTVDTGHVHFLLAPVAGDTGGSLGRKCLLQLSLHVQWEEASYCVKEAPQLHVCEKSMTNCGHFENPAHLPQTERRGCFEPFHLLDHFVVR